MPRHHADFLEAYLQYTEGGETPPHIHFWSGVWAISAALRRRVWFTGGKFHWAPNWFIALVGPPGVIKKSTTSDIALKVIEGLPGNPINFGLDSGTWHGMIDDFNESEVDFEWTDGSRYRVSPLAMNISEWGTFLKLDQSGLEEFLIQMWDSKLSARPFVHRTQTHGKRTVQNGSLTMIGCTTLGWLQRAMPASTLETGLVSRLLFVYGDRIVRPICLPNREPGWDPALDTERRRKLTEDLAQISTLYGEYSMPDDAYQWFKAWYDEMQTGARKAELTSERFDVYRSRKQTHVVKLAMALAASRGSEMTLTRDIMQNAVRHLEAAESSVVKVFETIGAPEETQLVNTLVSMVKHLASHDARPVTTKALYQRLRVSMGWTDLSTAITQSVAAGLLRIAPTGAKDHNGNAELGVIPVPVT